MTTPELRDASAVLRASHVPGRNVSGVQVVRNIIALVVFASVLAGIVYLAITYHRRQQDRIRAVAERHGLHLDLAAKSPPRLGFDLFDQGSSRQLSIQMWRPGEHDSVFQYEYTVRNGNRNRTFMFSAALVALPFRAPHMVISTETWWTKARRLVGWRDVEVESPAFNDRYHVRCRDERFAITLLDPAMIDWFLSSHSGTGAVTFEFRDSWMLCHCGRLDVEQLPALLTWAQSVRHELPAVLADLYGGAS